MTYQAGGSVPNETSLLSDQYWLLSHHEHDGSARVDREVLETGLAGAVIAELLILGRLHMIEKKICVWNVTPTQNPLLDLVVSMIGSGPELLGPMKCVQAVRDAPYSVGRQRRANAISLDDAVGLQLQAAGLVIEQETRGMFRSSTRLVPINWRTAAAPGIRIGYYLGRLHEMDTRARVLAKLAMIVGLEGQIGAGTSLSTRDAIETAVQQYHPDPLGHEILTILLDGVDRAVAAVALRIRR